MPIYIPGYDPYQYTRPALLNAIGNWDKRQQQSKQMDMFNQDIQQLQNFNPMLPPPSMQTPMGQQLLSQMVMQGAQQGDSFTLGEGEKRFDALGRPIAENPANTAGSMTPSQQINQRKLNLIDQLQQKKLSGNITNAELSQLNDLLGISTESQTQASQPILLGKDNPYGQPVGTLAQFDKAGNFKIISSPPSTDPNKRIAEVKANKLDALLQKEQSGSITPSESSQLNSLIGISTPDQEKRAGKPIMLEEGNDFGFQKGTVVQYDQNGLLKIVREPPDGAVEDKTKSEDALRNEFAGYTKTYRQIKDSYDRILASAEDPSAAGDLALIFNFMKILDPGSVVRESEFANAENAAGVPSQIRRVWNKVLTGEKLEDNQRLDFVDRAKRLYAGKENDYKTKAQWYTDMSDRLGLNTENIIPPAAVSNPTQNLSQKSLTDLLRERQGYLKGQK